MIRIRRMFGVFELGITITIGQYYGGVRIGLGPIFVSIRLWDIALDDDIPF